MGDRDDEDWQQAQAVLRRTVQDIDAVANPWPFPDRCDPPLIAAIAEYCLAPRPPAEPPTTREHHLARLAWSGGALPVLRAVGPVGAGPPSAPLVARIAAHQQSARMAEADGERVQFEDGTEFLRQEPWGPAVLVGTLDEGPDPWSTTWDPSVDVVERALEHSVIRFMESARRGGPAHVFKPDDEDLMSDQHLAVLLADRLVKGCRCGARNCQLKHRLREGDLHTRALRVQLVEATTGHWRFRPGAFAGSMLADELLDEGRSRFDLGYVRCDECGIVPDDDVGHACRFNGSVKERFVKRGCVARASAVVQVDVVKCRECSTDTVDRYVRRGEVVGGCCRFCERPLLLVCKKCPGLFSLAEPSAPCSGPERHRLHYGCDQSRCTAPATEERVLWCRHGEPADLKGLKNRYVKRWVLKARELPLDDARPVGAGPDVS